jgi:hypothetical protein
VERTGWRRIVPVDGQPMRSIITPSFLRWLIRIGLAPGAALMTSVTDVMDAHADR